MKYALLINEDHANYSTPESWEAIIKRHMAFSEKHGAAIVGGEGLENPETATTLKRAGEQVDFHDGPFAEAREQLGGFYLVEAASLDEAMAIAKDIPMAGDGAVEIRPVHSVPE
ncbi:YciI family protein [Altererythrobacter sp. ZODW24]|uniref:YciI family protein n=1 Tax=Altererythrobacter sp. ZODW24 TaxID=2185142 RepID=UPI000DF775A7|nr:YciI family protein [Altererythrobacter sp. ZODW24]